jgi:hypothetical protein
MNYTKLFIFILVAPLSLHGMEQETSEAKPVIKLSDILNTLSAQTKTLKSGQQIEVDAATYDTFYDMQALGENSKGNVISLLHGIYTLENDSVLDKNYKTTTLNYTEHHGTNHFTSINYDNYTIYFAHHLILKKLFKHPFLILESCLAKTYYLSIIYPSRDLDKDNFKGFSLRTSTDYIEVDNPDYTPFKLVHARLVSFITINTKMLDITYLLSNQRH